MEIGRLAGWWPLEFELTILFKVSAKGKSKLHIAQRARPYFLFHRLHIDQVQNAVS